MQLKSLIPVWPELPNTVLTEKKSQTSKVMIFLVSQNMSGNSINKEREREIRIIKS